MAMELGGSRGQFQKGAALSKNWKNSRSSFVQGRRPGGTASYSMLELRGNNKVGGRGRAECRQGQRGVDPFLEEVRSAGSALVTSHGFSRSPGKEGFVLTDASGRPCVPWCMRHTCAHRGRSNWTQGVINNNMRLGRKRDGTLEELKVAVDEHDQFT